MKKRKYILPVLAGLALALASCSSKDEESTGINDTPAVFNPAYLGSNAYDQAENIKDDEQRFEAKEINKLEFKINGVDYENIGDIKKDDTLKTGLVALKDKDNKVGVYSILFKKFIIAPQSSIEETNVFIRNYTNLDDLVISMYNSKTLTYEHYDLYGNLLLKQSSALEKLSDYETLIVNGEKYGILRLENSTIRYYKYDKNNLKLSEINRIPEPKPVDRNENYDGPKFDDTMSTIYHDLRPLGVDAYINWSGSTDTYSIYRNGMLTRTINVNFYQNAVVVGKSIIIQTLEPVSEDAQDYDIIIADLETRRRNEEYEKFKVSSKLYDVESDKFEDINLDYLISSYGRKTLLNDFNGKSEFTGVEVMMFSKTTLQNDYSSKKVVINDKGEIVYNTQNIYYHNLVKLGSKYFDNNYRVLYDENLNPIAVLDDLDYLYLDTKNNLIYGTFNGKWGIIGNDGKVKAEFIYDSLKPLGDYNYYDMMNHALNVKGDCIIASVYSYSNGDSGALEFYRINVVTGTSTYVGNDLQNVSDKVDDLFFFKDDNELHVLNQTGDLLVLNNVNNYSFKYINDSYTGATKVMLKVETYDSTSMENITTFYVVDVCDSKINF